MSFLEIVELVGLVAFAMTGILVGIEYCFDIFGIFVLAFVTALGGGLTRDMMLGLQPPVGISNMLYIATVFLTVVVFLLLIKAFKKKFVSQNAEKLKSLITFFDAIGLGVFAVSGTAFAMDMMGEMYRDMPTVCMFAGVATSIVGGVIRDVLANRVPVVLRKEVYAVLALVGSIGFYYTAYYWNTNWAMAIWAVVIIGARLFAVRKNLQLYRVDTGSFIEAQD